jgi:hypothetical protein
LPSPTISRTSFRGGRPSRSATPEGPRIESNRVLAAGKK